MSSTATGAGAAATAARVVEPPSSVRAAVSDTVSWRTAACGHASQAGQPAAPEHVQDDSLDHIVGRVRDRDHIGACLKAGAFEKLVSQRARSGLHRAAWQRSFSTLDQQVDAK